MGDSAALQTVDSYAENYLQRAKAFQADLEDQCAVALETLSPRQRTFAKAVATGDSQEQAALKAGYTPKTARAGNHRLMANVGVRKAINALNQLHQLQHGIDPRIKRHKLLTIADRASTPGDTYQPGSAVSAMRTLCELDGDIRQQGSSNTPAVSITITTGVPAETVIEADQGQDKA